jgi:hypothetical protein
MLHQFAVHLLLGPDTDPMRDVNQQLDEIVGDLLVYGILFCWLFRRTDQASGTTVTPVSR